MDRPGKGYSGWSMSNRAVEAYDDGEMPESKWTKKAMILAIEKYADENDLYVPDSIRKMKKADLFDRYMMRTGWHHTSKFFNRTNFYGLDEDALDEDLPELTEELRTKRDEAKRKAAEAEAQKWARKNAEREARWAAEAEYKDAHGCRPDTWQSYIIEHPECVSQRVSRKGNLIYIINFNGKIYEKFEEHVDGYMYGWNALNEEQ